MTPLSLVPEQGKHVGMTYADLVQAIVDEALKDRKDKDAK
jgi:D-alanine-D-alanine ligase